MTTIDPVTAFFQSLADAFSFLDKLGPCLNALIESDVPAHIQHETTMRIRHCKRHCRIQHYNIEQVKELVEIDFPDFSFDTRLNIAKLICFELKIIA